MGLEVGALIGKTFLKIEHLHYGYWADGLPVDITNLHIAQDNYAKLLLSHVPAEAKSILDVGCGFGQLAKMLINEGHQVDCVSPSPFLAEQARNLLGDESTVFQNCYEDMQTDRRYDLVLFSESFQYINPKEALDKTFSLLNNEGFLLISDIFRKDVPGKSAVSGGHLLSQFRKTVGQYPFELLKDEDITEQTAPTIDIEDHVFKEVGQPAMVLGEELAKNRYPVVYLLLKSLLRKKIEKLQAKYISGERTGENFKKYKTYRILLYKLKQ
ncbi:MAG: class I SAM-dependent methyltransferase [Sedimentisphaerales bacterium]|nr:class I SAM-dependent methyltransferase [Sedimentisphaerales bacterium]